MAYEASTTDKAEVQYRAGPAVVTRQSDPIARRCADALRVKDGHQARVRTKPDLDAVRLPIGSGVELSRKHEQ